MATNCKYFVLCRFSLPAPSHHLNQLQIHLKEQRRLGHSILDRSGQTLAVLSQRPCFIAKYVISRWTTNDPRNQCTTGPVSQEHAFPFLNESPRDVVPGQNMGSGAVPVLVVANLTQCAEPTSVASTPQKRSTPGHAHVFAGRHMSRTRFCV